MLWAHEHSYERLLPLYNRQVRYQNPFLLIHIKYYYLNFRGLAWDINDTDIVHLVCCRFAMDLGKNPTPTLVLQFT